ncbi:MAG: hypothetical protein MJE12_06770, partial [Alphaproteobacteria bacterium]|nr:hypothetical protein [Alphaproteobacteria bacterium]
MHVLNRINRENPSRPPRSRAARIAVSGLLFVLCLLAAGCEEKPQVDKTVIRSIKWIKLTQPLADEQRLIS